MNVWLLLIGALLWSGCATSTVEKRKQQQASAYSELPPEFKAAVAQGQIKVGMTTNAVYIAWGKPAEVLIGESAAGQTMTWIYRGTQLVEYRYWGYPGWCYYDRFYSYPFFAYEYYPHSYLRAEVVFEKGLVKEWRSLPRP